MEQKIFVITARICHEANRAYCAGIGDNSQPTWSDAPQWQRDLAIKGVHFHWEALENGLQVSPSVSHDSWLEEKRRDGWKYGPVKDAEKKEHPCFVPYEQLPYEQMVKDYIFAAIVHSIFQSRQNELAATA